MDQIPRLIGMANSTECYIIAGILHSKIKSNMNRHELEHIIRAAGEIADVNKVIIFVSQSILAQFPELSPSNAALADSDMATIQENREILIRSIEADIMVPDSQEKTDLIEGAIGELSLFHDTFGYYAQGVDRTTSKLPDGWESRLIEICNENTNYVSGMCLEVHDLMISKLYAGRKKDIEFFMAAVKMGLLFEETLRERLALTTFADERRRSMLKHIERGFSK